MGLFREMRYPRVMTCPKCRKKVVPNVEWTVTVKEMLFSCLCCLWYVRTISDFIMLTILVSVGQIKDGYKTNAQGAKLRFKARNVVYKMLLDVILF